MSTKRQVLLLSSSAPYGFEYLQYAKNDILELLNRNNVKKLIFIPYALRDYNGYTDKVKQVFNEWGYDVQGIHTFEYPSVAMNSAEAIFIGGGNTFQLLKGLYDNNLMEVIRHRVLQDGVPYIGSSAGTNVATKSIHTTNDMPIVYPPSFDGLALVPFNINPHYLDAVEGDTHQGETREERIQQFLELPAGPVLGMREGATVQVMGDTVTLQGISSAKLFYLGKPPKEYEVGSDLSFLLQSNGDRME